MKFLHLALGKARQLEVENSINPKYAATVGLIVLVLAFGFAIYYRVRIRMGNDDEGA